MIDAVAILYCDLCLPMFAIVRNCIGLMTKFRIFVIKLCKYAQFNLPPFIFAKPR